MRRKRFSFLLIIFLVFIIGIIWLFFPEKRQSVLNYIVDTGQSIGKFYDSNKRLPESLDEINMEEFFRPPFSIKKYKILYTKVDEKNFTLVAKVDSSIVFFYPYWEFWKQEFNCCFSLYGYQGESKGRELEYGYKSKEFLETKIPPFDSASTWPDL